MGDTAIPLGMLFRLRSGLGSTAGFGVNGAAQISRHLAHEPFALRGAKKPPERLAFRRLYDVAS
jgi:hypothetical protein